MNQNHIKDLLRKHFEGNISLAELQELEQFFLTQPKDTWVKMLHEIDVPQSFDIGKSEEEIDNRLQEIYQTIQKEAFIEKPVLNINEQKYRWKPIIKYLVAACALIIGFAIYFNQKTELPQENIAVTDILPAKNIAQINLNNGKSIEVDSSKVGVLYKDDQIEVYKSESGEISYRATKEMQSTPQYITVQTPKAGVTTVKLADGTVVELNADSYIKYPIEFAEDAREVTVEGELLFKVASNKSWPFKVKSNKQQLEVLGTTFNLQTRDGIDKTTLIEGSVKITVAEKEYLLKPGDESIVSDKVNIKNVNTTEKTAWSEKRFVFHNSSFIEILKEIENWYDVEFVMEEQLDLNVQMVGEVSRKIKLRELLNILEMNSKYKFEIQERRVFVKKNTAK
ncbi:FecR family protein [Sphingobacterium lactis]|uniref:FecR family protein n=1 Tax=Sphingobacterium lactis TaxID=797291 RepID=UPI003F821140